MAFILALDQGTSSSRAILFDEAGVAVAAAQREYEQHFPSPGLVEHDAEEIWESQRDVAHAVLRDAGVAAREIVGIGISNQRETTLLWERKSGRPIHPAIVWQDRRTADRCRDLREGGYEDMVRAKTGLEIDPYFSATKLEWLLQNVDQARERAAAGELAFGTVDTWLVWKLTGGAVHVTDLTNASRTMLFDIRRCAWDDELLELFDVPNQVLPSVVPSMAQVGVTEFLGAPVPIAGIAGDQQAALFGQIATRRGMVKNTYGTGCFLLMYTGHEPVPSDNRLITTLAASSTENPEYALEGSIFTGGSVVQWLRDGLRIVDDASETEAMARAVTDNDGVYFVPAFTGLGAPHWDPHARGTIIGLTRGTRREHLVRAALEGIAYQSVDVIRAMEADSGLSLAELRVDGGAAANDFLMQFQADLLGVPVQRPKVLETTALGAAFLAGLATGFWSDRDEIASHWQLDRTFEPSMPSSRVESLLDGWHEAVQRSLRLAHD